MTSDARPAVSPVSPFAPFRHRAFFGLWLGVVVASIGIWGQMVGAQWLFINDPNAATIVPLVQTASTLPMMLLALPAGVLADASLGRVKQHRSSNQVLAVAGAGFAVAFAGVAVTSSMWVALPLLVVCGFGWTATVATVISELQLFLPGWVRARAIAIYLMVFLGTQAVAAPIWGVVTQYAGLRTALLAAAVLLVGSVLLGRVLRVPDSDGLDRSSLAYWDTPRLRVDPSTSSGPVVVSIRYEVSNQNREAFLEAMQVMRRSRLRSGSSRWNLYRVGENPHRYVEQFEVPSWEEHELQHQGRLTAEDQAIEDAAFAHITGRPQTEHLLPAAARVADEAFPAEPHRDGAG